MPCDLKERESIAERYLAGKMEESEREAFEIHYFDCDACIAYVQALQAVDKSVVPAARPRAAWSRWAWAIAAMVFLAAGGAILRWSRNTSSTTIPEHDGSGRANPPAIAPQIPYDELAKLEPPAYRPSRLRGITGGDKGFQTAMKHYHQGDYRAAITGLQNLDRPDAQFFLGASFLMTGEADPAIAAFEHVVQRGDTPYLEDAHFYLAKAFLRKHDAEHARKDLAAVIALQGDFEAQARELLAKIPESRIPEK